MQAAGPECRCLVVIALDSLPMVVFTSPRCLWKKLMPRFAANLTMMFNELPAAQRFAAARAAGFDAVEYLSPYADPAVEVRTWLDDAGLALILLNTSPGDARAGERGLAALPGRQEDFLATFEQALQYATTLGAGMIHVMAGVVPPGQAAACEDTFVANLAKVAPTAAAQGVRLLIEPLNQRDVPGYLHSTADHSRSIIDAVGSDNVFMQFDCYHLQIMHGDLLHSYDRHADVIAHVQFSSVPGRHEPQYGEVNMPVFFEHLDDTGYQGWVGCEYHPRTTTLAGLTWAHVYGIGL